MQQKRPSAAPPMAGLVGLLVPAAYLMAWDLLVERPTCTNTGVLACAGPALLMYVVGVPVAYVAWSLGLRVLRVPLPWLVPPVAVLVMVPLLPVSEPIDPPTWIWPAVLSLICGMWAHLVPALPSTPNDSDR